MFYVSYYALCSSRCVFCALPSCKTNTPLRTVKLKAVRRNEQQGRRQSLWTFRALPKPGEPCNGMIFFHIYSSFTHYFFKPFNITECLKICKIFGENIIAAKAKNNPLETIHPNLLDLFFLHLASSFWNNNTTNVEDDQFSLLPSKGEKLSKVRLLFLSYLLSTNEMKNVFWPF